MKRQIVTCTGYGSTGSSVVTDLLMEFEDAHSYGDFEFRFFQDPHGLRDLEYALFDNNNRLNTGYYIKKFIESYNYVAKSRVYNYEKHFNSNFVKFSDEFMREIIDVEWSGYWHQDIIEESLLRKFCYYAERFIQKKIFKLRYSSANFYNTTMYYAYPDSREDFYRSVRKYTDNLMNSLNLDGDFPIIALDQLVPPDHTLEHMKYYNNLKAIIVDRDPRDLFLLEKYVYHHRWVPYHDIDKFVLWYRKLRKHRELEQKHPDVMHIMFEDFIYNYEDSIDKVVDFMSLNKDKWKNQKKYFDPSKSIKNTRKWEECLFAKDEVKNIEDTLQEYLYKF
jgi:hypothetical protein